MKEEKMAELLKERSEMDPAFTWDLSKMYESDEAWEEALPKIDPFIEKVASFKGKLNDVKMIREFLDASVLMERNFSNLFGYAHLRKCEDTRDDKAQDMYSRVYGKYVSAMSAAAFAEPEILSLSEENLKELLEAPEMAPYRFKLQKLLDVKAHTLSAEAETLLAGFGEVFAAPGQIAENLENADLLFAPVQDGKGEEHEVTGSNYILLQTSEDRVLRENSFRSYYKSFKEHINTFAATYSGAVKGAAAQAAARRYSSSRAMSMAEEHVPEVVYDNLVETVHKFLPVMYRYVALRKKMLGVDELHYYDVYTPLLKGSSRKYTYEEAQELVLMAVSPLGEEYVSVVKQAFKDRWIDVYPNKGKRGGAFSSGTYDSMPYILTNFTGTLDSVFTIAHEMGHSLHTWLANHHQPFHYAEYTLFVAEVASTVNENLLVEQLLEKAETREEKLTYLNQYLEDFKSTVFRQTMFAEFEMKAHAMAERGESLTPGSLSGIYKDLIAQYFGPELVIDDEVQYEWARIPHFYSPFYVYKYATSYCSSAAISEAIRTKGRPAVDKYLEFLSLGGSAYPLEELCSGGVDLSTAAPLETALNKFDSILREAESVFYG